MFCDDNSVVVYKQEKFDMHDNNRLMYEVMYNSKYSHYILR